MIEETSVQVPWLHFCKKTTQKKVLFYVFTDIT